MPPPSERNGMSIDHSRLTAPDGRNAPARAAASWQQRLRTRFVRLGIRAMYGRTDDVTAAATADMPLVSAAARLLWLKALGAAGVKKFAATSALGHDFVCHTGDLASFPFYYRRAYHAELTLAAAWLDGVERPVVYDIGANGGFVATHLAQMLAPRAARIYAFEPVPTTFAMLAQAVESLGLSGIVHPVAAAVVDTPGPVRMSCSERNSLLAQVSPRGLNPRAGNTLVEAEGITLDGFVASAGALPDLLKIDVEGCEAAVLRGARDLISRPDRPAILLEFNPVTLAEGGTSAGTLRDLLPGYALHYVDDLRGQVFPLGAPIRDLAAIDWICNLFAVPRGEDSARRFASALQRL
jgi:FkbM family methyltransferase